MVTIHLDQQSRQVAKDRKDTAHGMKQDLTLEWKGLDSTPEKWTQAIRILDATMTAGDGGEKAEKFQAAADKLALSLKGMFFRIQIGPKGLVESAEPPKSDDPTKAPSPLVFALKDVLRDALLPLSGGPVVPGAKWESKGERPVQHSISRNVEMYRQWRRICQWEGASEPPESDCRLYAD